MVDDPAAEGIPDTPIHAYTCPYANECGYHGVFLYERGFKEHMQKFHKGRKSIP